MQGHRGVEIRSNLVRGLTFWRDRYMQSREIYQLELRIDRAIKEGRLLGLSQVNGCVVGASVKQIMLSQENGV